MADKSLFVFVTGAGSLVVVPELLERCVSSGYTVYSVLTPNVASVTDPEALMAVPGNHWVRDYGDDPLDRFPFGAMLVAPCTFNTLNKMALGIADNLVTAMLGDAIGAGCPVVAAPGMNRGQWANPRLRTSLRTLTEWGVRVVPPRRVDGRLTLASLDDIVAAL